MYKLIRLYNQNRKKVWTVILIIASIILLIQLLNNMAKTKEDAIVEDAIASSNYNNTSKELVSDKSAVTGERVFETDLKNANDVISKFMESCNNKDIVSAYSLLSSDCKDQLFQNEDIFISNYYNVIFENENKLYTIENWANDTYKITMTSNDILSTGNINQSSNVDYFTIVNENGQNKLNIKNFVERVEIEKIYDENDIEVNVKRKNTYMDYEIYDLEITNNSQNDILLDNKQNTKSIYLEDSKGARYYAFANEIIDSEFIVRKNQTKNLSIKFSNNYSSNRRISYLSFSKLILNLNEYEEIENKLEYDDFYNLTIGVK